jgi:hypothetical protein
MKRFHPRRPSPAMAVALLALFVAMGGTGYAALNLPKNSVGAKQIKKNAVTGVKLKKNAVTGTKVKDHSLTGADISAGTLGKTPSTANADHATAADQAAPRGPAGGALTGNYPSPGLAAPENWHEINAPGEPTFQNGWANEDPATETTAAFYKDPYDVIHLKGLITPVNDLTVFTLPPGYRPAHDVIEMVARGGGSGQVIIRSSGAVDWGSGTGFESLDGVTFRAGE